LVVSGALIAALVGLYGPGEAGGKDEVWKQFLPAKAYRTLLERAVENIEEALTGKVEEEAIKKAQFNAVMIAAYTLSTKDGGAPQELATVRENALKIAQMVTEKKKLNDAKKLAKELLTMKANPGVKMDVPDLAKYIDDRADIMEHYKTKMKGGDGIHPDLQSNIRLKGTQNGIEEKIRTLSMKEIKPLVLDKEANELALMAYRAAVHGEVTYYFAPAKKVGNKDPREWREISLALRDTGIELANAAMKKSTENAFKASNNLNSACSRCHAIFRMGN
jgi:hypothetical protein